MARIDPVKDAIAAAVQLHVCGIGPDDLPEIAGQVESIEATQISARETQLRIKLAPAGPGRSSMPRYFVVKVGEML